MTMLALGIVTISTTLRNIKITWGGLNRKDYFVLLLLPSNMGALENVRHEARTTHPLYLNFT